MRELFDGAAEVRPRAQPIARATLAKFKFKTQAHKAFEPQPQP